MQLKIGELAKRVGLTVRALHHYDAIGLLAASYRTESGSRRYTKDDVVRLHRIQALKQFGYPLNEVRMILDDPDSNPGEIIERQIRVFDEQQRQAQQLGTSLRELSAQIASCREVAASKWLDLLELMAIYRRHFTDRELRALHDSSVQAGMNLDAQWTELIDVVENAIHRGEPSRCPAAQDLAWRWVHLVIATTGNDSKLASKLMAMQVSEDRAQDIVRIRPDTLRWIGEALAYARLAVLKKHLTAKEAKEVLARHLASMAHMKEWPAMVALVREQLDSGSSAASERTLELAARWRALFRDSYCGDNMALESKVRDAIRQEPILRLGVGVDDRLIEYIQTAIHHLPEPRAVEGQ